MLYAFFRVIPRRLNFLCQRFGTLCLFHLHRRVGSSPLPANEDGTDRVFRNIGIENSDAGELPRRKHTAGLILTSTNGRMELTCLHVL